MKICLNWEDFMVKISGVIKSGFLIFIVRLDCV